MIRIHLENKSVTKIIRLPELGMYHEVIVLYSDSDLIRGSASGIMDPGPGLVLEQILISIFLIFSA